MLCKKILTVWVVQAAHVEGLQRNLSVLSWLTQTYPVLVNNYLNGIFLSPYLLTLSNCLFILLHSVDICVVCIDYWTLWHSFKLNGTNGNQQTKTPYYWIKGSPPTGIRDLEEKDVIHCNQNRNAAASPANRNRSITASAWREATLLQNNDHDDNASSGFKLDYPQKRRPQADQEYPVCNTKRKTRHEQRPRASIKQEATSTKKHHVGKDPGCIRRKVLPRPW
jgi:hypothetical protein